MTKGTLKALTLFAASLVGLAIGSRYGPASALPAVFVVEEQHVEIVQRHFFSLGLAAALCASLAGVAVRAPSPMVLGCFLVAGLGFHISTQAGEPGFLAYLPGSTVEFMAPYAIGGILAFVAVRGFQVAWSRRRGGGGGTR